jgi:hypothetical protein
MLAPVGGFIQNVAEVADGCGVFGCTRPALPTKAGAPLACLLSQAIKELPTN